MRQPSRELPSLLQVLLEELHSDHVEGRPDELIGVYPDVGVGGDTKPVRQSQLFDALATVMGSVAEAASSAPSTAETPLVTRHSLKEEKARSRAHLLVAEDNAVNQKV
ncbi:MAG: hypothetical protein WKF67_12390, partial [Rubrobacteraceae bacterium]